MTSTSFQFPFSFVNKARALNIGILLGGYKNSTITNTALMQMYDFGTGVFSSLGNSVYAKNSSASFHTPSVGYRANGAPGQPTDQALFTNTVDSVNLKTQVSTVESVSGLSKARAASATSLTHGYSYGGLTTPSAAAANEKYDLATKTFTSFSTTSGLVGGYGNVQNITTGFFIGSYTGGGQFARSIDFSNDTVSATTSIPTANSQRLGGEAVSSATSGYLFNANYAASNGNIFKFNMTTLTATSIFTLPPVVRYNSGLSNTLVGIIGGGYIFTGDSIVNDTPVNRQIDYTTDTITIVNPLFLAVQAAAGVQGKTF